MSPPGTSGCGLQGVPRLPYGDFVAFPLVNEKVLVANQRYRIIQSSMRHKNSGDRHEPRCFYLRPCSSAIPTTQFSSQVPTTC